MIGFVLILLVFGKVYNLNDASCKQTFFNSLYGTIFSSSNGDCIYKIDVSASSSWVLLEWTAFKFDATMPNCNDGDFVEVFTGCTVKTSVSRFCTRNMKLLPHAIFSFDGCIDIHLKPISQKYVSSFTANYRAYSKSQSLPSSNNFYSSCASWSNIYSNVGVVTSPQWPLTYKNKNFISKWDCEWDIEVYSNKVIKLNFMDMDLYNPLLSTCDQVKVKGKKSLQVSLKDERAYCRRDQPFSLITKYYSLEIDFERSLFSTVTSYRGFVVGFVAYDEAVSVTAVTWKFIVGGVFALLFVIVFLAICCFRAYKRRQVVTTVQYSSAQYGTVLPESSDSYPKVNLSTQPGYPQQTGYPQQQTGYPQQQVGYPQQQAGYPPQQAGYPPQQAGYPQQTVGYPLQSFGENPQQATYPTPVEYPVKQGYPVDFAAYPLPTQQANANIPPPPYPGVQQFPYPGDQQPPYPGAQQTHSYIPK